MTNSTTCLIVDCDSPVHCRGWCSSHYTRWIRYGDPETPLKVRRFIGVTFDERVDCSAGSGHCWPWLGQINKYGYGIGRSDGVVFSAHREAFKRAGNELPPRASGMVLDHICHDPETCVGGNDCPHRRCCNPAHLRLVTNKANISVGRTRSGRHAARTHCSEGHLKAGENLYVAPGTGMKECRICRNKRKRDHARRKRAQLRRSSET